MAKISRAVITAAGPRQRALVLQSLVDRNGEPKQAIQVLLEEALAGGVEEVAVVIFPGDQAAYRSAAGKFAGHLHFVEQTEPRGYGHALLQARAWVGGHSFLHMVGDHLHVSRGEVPCARQLTDLAMREDCSVSAVQSTRERFLPNFGAVGGKRLPGIENLYQIDEVIEKPTPTEAEQRLIICGLRAGHYLCFFGMHVFTPRIFEFIEAQPRAEDQSIPLSPALAMLAKRERYLAAELQGARYDIGDRYGLWAAQLAIGLAGRDREELLARIVELLASRG